MSFIGRWPCWVRVVAAASTSLLMISGCGHPEQQGESATGTFSIAGRYTPYHPAGTIADCNDHRSFDVFAEEGGAGRVGALLATSPLVAKEYNSSTQSCVYEFAVTLPIRSGRYGICLEYPNARSVIEPSLWLTKAQIDNVVQQSGGMFVLSI